MQSTYPVVPVVPAHGEGESGVDESLSKLDVTTGNREVGDHFTKGDLRMSALATGSLAGTTGHDGEADRTHESVAHEETEGTTVCEGATSTQEETSTTTGISALSMSLNRQTSHDTTDGDHGNMPRLELTLKTDLDLAFLRAIIGSRESGDIANRPDLGGVLIGIPLLVVVVCHFGKFL